MKGSRLGVGSLLSVLGSPTTSKADKLRPAPFYMLLVRISLLLFFKNLLHGEACMFMRAYVQFNRIRSKTGYCSEISTPVLSLTAGADLIS